jgi:tetratricopeptide (TPR) repeat protein
VVHIFNVPFFPDNTDQCGPSSLASVLNFWGKTVTPDELRAEVYAPSLNGTLPMDLLPAVRNRGLVGQVVNGDFDVLKEELRGGRPVIAYLDFGTRKHPIGHYVVVLGFDEEQKGLYIHSGLNQEKFASYKRFDRGWKDTDRWMLIISSTRAVPSNEGRLPPLRHGLTPTESLALGQTYEAQGLKRDAAQQYRAALLTDKRYVPALVALGNLSYEEKDYRTAEKYFRRAQRADPNHPGANNNLAMTYLAQGKKLKEAEKLAQKAAADPAMRPYAEDTLTQIRIANP